MSRVRKVSFDQGLMADASRYRTAEAKKDRAARDKERMQLRDMRTMVEIEEIKAQVRSR